MENKAFKVAGICNLMRRDYCVDPSCIDVESEVDDRLSMRENWNILKPRVMLISPKDTRRFS